MEDGKNPISPTKGGGNAGRIRVSSTRRGLILAGLGCALFLAGMWRVDGVMAAMGLVVGVLFLVALISGYLNLGHFTLHFRGPRRVESGKGFTGRLMLSSRGRGFDAFWIEFRMLAMEEKEISGRSGWIVGRGTAEVPDRMVLGKRGLAMVHRGRLRSSFPLGLMTFTRDLAVEVEIGVLPKPVIPRELYLGGYLLDGSPFGSSRHSGGLGEWKGLRESRGGDGLRRIAWAASLRSEAAGGTMLVREYEPPGFRAEGCMVVFHSHGGDGSLIRPDRFEKSLELLYGALGALVGRGMSVRWVADFGEWEENEVRTRKQLAVARERIMIAERAAGTEAHNLIETLGRAREHECIVVISDMPRVAWEGFIPVFSIPPVLVDIADYDGSRRKKGRRVLKGGLR